MKRIALIATACCFAFAVTACDNQPAKPAATTTTETTNTTTQPAPAQPAGNQNQNH
ncbi:Uncharacterised protein [Legionella wadsworthii]|uniref:Uncharacterized protein n=1 Tax=Legionella wadsworthii TaxID=28088 RepID=A0A378LPX0_9GAMM|nr:hypothetical protein [Legionella wadsworthii]STY28986.1 Uncharacterised protein [Legionella wadsworthii]